MHIRKELNHSLEQEKQQELNKILNDLHLSIDSFIMNLRIKNIEAENFRRDMRNQFKFLND